MNNISIKYDFKSYLNLDIYTCVGEIDKIARYCKDNFQEEVNEVIRIADDVVNKTFKFEWKWDMERTYIPYTFEDEIIWDMIPNDDPEWIFMLNRHRYWVTLGQAYALTNDEKYARAFVEQLSHWIKIVRPIENTDKTTWRTIDTGIRCENWIKAYTYFQSSEYITQEFTHIFVKSLKEHMDYLHKNYKESGKLSNWGVLENHGLLVASIFLEKIIEEKDYLNISIDRLQEQINLQVMEDGMHWEQSPMYLNEVLHCYMDTLIVCKNNNIELPNDIVEKTKKLAYADFYMKKPNHTQVCQSDSDDTDLRDMITKAAYLYSDEVLKFGAYEEIDFESIWDLGYKSIKEYKSINTKAPDQASYAFEDSGNYYMRSGWGSDDNYMYFHCGTLGSGHGHADLLHVSIFANKEDYLIDSGRYTYIEGDAKREYLKSCRAHNTTTVDDTDFTIIDGSWGYKKVATPIKHPFITKDNFDYCEGSHLGYIDRGIFTNRKVLYIKPNIWILVDEFYGEGEHEYKQHFHFAHDVYLDEQKTICKGKNGRLTLHHLNILNRSIEKTPVSYNYNKLEEQDTLTTSCENNGFTSIITVITSQDYEEKNISVEKLEVKNCNDRLLDNFEAEAIKISTQNETYTVLVCHNEIFKGKKLLKVNNYDIYGKVVLITEKKGKITREVIKY
ncbi:hypothetical protein CHL78_011780 [Romboutsia weinsteinii]|uniref:Uncharacterized protein n=1 Tax=Romboutsia weinsteinii TaxID=2020949 RepID=A0A371J231_9FIRM|nr:alginate lyase family protein [Romboutsia weinsteinii]RDY26871.1 hypothetical protein CHL78_011780 [Romboutsia weinsteinii]